MSDQIASNSSLAKKRGLTLVLIHVKASESFYTKR